MKSAVFKIYISLLLLLVILSLATIVLFAIVTQKRFETYVDNHAPGIAFLIGDGAAKWSGQNQDRWLTLTSQITNLELKPTDLVITEPKVVTLNGKTVTYQVTDQINYPKATILVDVDNATRLEVTFFEYNSVSVSGLLQLISVRLGVVSKEIRFEELERLNSLFSFNVNHINFKDTDLGNHQLRLLQQGELVTQFAETTFGNVELSSFKRLGNSNEILVFGPIELFERFPIQLIGIILLCAVVAILISSILIVRPLDKRLHHMMQTVDNMSESHQKITIKGNDSLSQFGAKINAMASNIFNLLEQQQDLLKSQQALTRAVSHEFRTPLVRLKYRTEMSTLDEDQKENFSKDIAQLHHLVDELLQYSTLQQTQPNLSIETIDGSTIAEWVKELALLANVQIQSKQLKSVQIIADAHYFKRLVENLITNAQRYAKKQIRITAQNIGPLQTVTIEDDGVGVPDELKTKIFEPFYRVDESRNRQTGGNGLGLSICSAIAFWHQGSIKVTDSELGGAKFVISLPTNLVDEPKNGAND